MSIWTSLLTGSSGLNAFGEAMGIVGDDIANVSTIGFKGSRAGFEDVLGGKAANGQNVGSGVHMSGPDTSFEQGSIQNTGRPLDMAVRGGGFFVLNGSHQGMNGAYYSRDGRFGFDRTGTVVNAEGLHLQGYQIDAQGVLATRATDIQMDQNSPPHATSRVTMALNFDPAATPPAQPFNPASPTATSNYQTSVTVYDSLGVAHRADMYFRAQGNGTWEWHALVNGGEITGGTRGVNTEIASGTVNFNANGELNTVTTTASTANFAGATQGQAITFNFGDPIATGGSGRAGSTQFAGSPGATGTNLRSLDQDGYAAGTLASVSIAQDGTISANYSNGRSTPTARVALATFASQQALTRGGNQLFTTNPASGEARVAAAATGGRGSVAAGALEGSNVDLAAELVTLIAYQRAFQANAKTVHTADEMLAEVAQLKR